MSDDQLPILTLTRRSVELTGTCRPWRALVEGTKDTDLLKVVRKCSPEELSDIGYYALALNRKNW